MGWSSGSSLMKRLISISEQYIPDKSQKEFFKEMIEQFEETDCDVLHECLFYNNYYDQAYESLYPEHYEHLMKN